MDRSKEWARMEEEAGKAMRDHKGEVRLPTRGTVQIPESTMRLVLDELEREYSVWLRDEYGPEVCVSCRIERPVLDGPERDNPPHEPECKRVAAIAAMREALGEPPA